MSSPGMENPEVALKGLGGVQKDILLWLGEEEGLTTPADLRRRWPPTRRVRNQEFYKLQAQIEALEGAAPRLGPTMADIFRTGVSNSLFGQNSALQQMIDTMKASDPFSSYATRDQELRRLQGQLSELSEDRMEELPHARYVKDEYFEAPTRSQPKGIEWNGQRFLGRQATKSESAKIATSLRKLAERRLVILHKAKGKRERTSHVELTQTGAIVAVKIRYDHL